MVEWLIIVAHACDLSTWEVEEQEDEDSKAILRYTAGWKPAWATSATKEQVCMREF